MYALLVVIIETRRDYNTYINLYLPTKCYYNHHNCVYWSKYLTTNGMKHLSICDKHITEYIRFNKVQTLHVSLKPNISDIIEKELRDRPHFRALKITLCAL